MPSSATSRAGSARGAFRHACARPPWHSLTHLPLHHPLRVATRGSAAAETRATRHQVLDPRTMDILARWINAGVVDEVHGVVKVGKEASVFHARASDAEPGPAPTAASASDTSDAEAASAPAAAAGEAQSRGREEEARARGHVLSRWQLQEETRPVGLDPDRALKIFKTTLNEFSRRVNYIVVSRLPLHRTHSVQSPASLLSPPPLLRATTGTTSNASTPTPRGSSSRCGRRRR